MKKTVIIGLIICACLLTGCSHDNSSGIENIPHTDTTSPPVTTVAVTTVADTTTLIAETTVPFPEYTFTPSLQSIEQIEDFGLISADGTIVQAYRTTPGGYGVSYIDDNGKPVFHPIDGAIFMDIPEEIPAACPVIKMNDFELVNKSGVEIYDQYYIAFNSIDRIYETPTKPGLYFLVVCTNTIGPMDDPSIPAVVGQNYLNYTYFFAVVVE